MKNHLLILISFFVTLHVQGQEIEISVGPTINNAFYYQFVTGGPTFKAKFGFNSAISYKYIINKKVNLYLDLFFQHCPIKVVPENTNPPIPNDQPPHTEKINLLSISPGATYNFNTGFYVSLAPILTYHTNYETIKDNIIQTIDNQTGIGLTLSFGKYIKIKSPLFLNIGPKLCIHNIIPFHDENLPLRMTTIGINCGLSIKYRINDQS